VKNLKIVKTVEILDLGRKQGTFWVSAEDCRNFGFWSKTEENLGFGQKLLKFRVLDEISGFG
jgi:hypothetical protein